MENILVIGIAGGTGSGKTTLMNNLIREFSEDVTILSHDNYYNLAPPGLGTRAPGQGGGAAPSSLLCLGWVPGLLGCPLGTWTSGWLCRAGVQPCHRRRVPGCPVTTPGLASASSAPGHR